MQLERIISCVNSNEELTSGEIERTVQILSDFPTLSKRVVVDLSSVLDDEGITDYTGYAKICYNESVTDNEDERDFAYAAIYRKPLDKDKSIGLPHFELFEYSDNKELSSRFKFARLNLFIRSIFFIASAYYFALKWKWESFYKVERY